MFALYGYKKAVIAPCLTITFKTEEAMGPEMAFSLVTLCFYQQSKPLGVFSANFLL